MKKPKFIENFYNWLFEEPKEGEGKKLRRLSFNKETGKLSWSKGEKPFKEEDIAAAKVEEFHLHDDESAKTRTAHMVMPCPFMNDVYRKNRFKVEFPGIPEVFFNSYDYMGTDVHSQKRLLTSNKVIKDDYSSFRVLMMIGSAGKEGELIDICDKLVELENNPSVGDIKIHMLDPTGVTIKTIVIPDCEVVEIKAFRNLDYGSYKEKTDDVLYGEIIVKHKQRKLK